MNFLKNIKLRSDEKVEHIIFHHSIIIVPHLIVCALILILDFFMMYFLFLQGWWGIALFAAVIGVVAFYIFRLMFLFKHNKLILTNQRVIDVEQATFFEEFISDYSYSEIKKAEAVVKGVGASLFHYGNLKLIIEKEAAPFELYKIPRPLFWQGVIHDHIFQFRQKLQTNFSANPLEHIVAEVGKLSAEQKEEVRKRLENS